MRCSLMMLGLVMLTRQTDALPESVIGTRGLDPSAHIEYALISVDGMLAKSMQAPDSPPRLTAQCTKTSRGKLRFEVMADLGGAPQVTFYPPWRPRNSQDLFPPTLIQTTITMEFLGYTRVKPVKRQWVTPEGLPDEYEYANPGLGSPNMEEFRLYLQYLRSLPTLRLTVPGKGAAQWDTTAWQRAIHSEPTCGASGL